MKVFPAQKSLRNTIDSKELHVREHPSSQPELRCSARPAETESSEGKMPGRSHEEKPVTVSGRRTEQILRMIAQGENLTYSEDLFMFYQWVHESYEALRFDPTRQQLFDDYCRSSDEPSYAIRASLGLWVLRLALRLV